MTQYHTLRNGCTDMTPDPAGEWVRREDYEALQQSQPYSYIGKDMQTVKAADLENNRDALRAGRDEGLRLLENARQIAGYVLIPTAKFNAILTALAGKGSKE